MGERSRNYLSQLKAMLIRNLLLKKREKRKTMAEVFLPLYSLGILIILKILLPNPNFPLLNTPRGDKDLLDHFSPSENHSIAVVPNDNYTYFFLEAVNDVWMSLSQDAQPLDLLYFSSEAELTDNYWLDPQKIPIAVIFLRNNATFPHLNYVIKTNPSFTVTPSTKEMFSQNENCRQNVSSWNNFFPFEAGDSCPVNQYYYSGFLALQVLLDFTKIRLFTNRSDLKLPSVKLELFPKDAFTGSWMVIFRVVIPIYMVIALSQFITYLLILIVGEKEKKIKEGMKIMGLHDSVFWLSWFLIYAAFTTFLAVVSCVLLFSLQVFNHTNYFLIFLLILFYSFSVIMFGFIITPFFDNAKTAGILGNFIVNFMSFLYFIQVFLSESSTILFWTVSLISPTGFALAMDKALVMDMKGEGVSLDNIWSGEGIPFGGSIIMMALDTVLYGLLAFYLDSVIPSEHGVKEKPWFCFTFGYWFPRQKHVPLIPQGNGESGTFNTTEEASKDVEPVSREMKGREAIRIMDLYKTFRNCNRPEVHAVQGINLTIYEGQITAILGHNGAGKTTLFNILTGLTAPTSGTISIFGYDVRDGNDMKQIRQMTGVCQQHDILFDLLTPREHLEFYAVLRGIAKDHVSSEVTKTMKDIDLVDKADTFVKYLSGGQKRKLSVGIAVIGDPKIVILDEPTAGVDPCSRRHMWSVLQNRRHGKVILLTTHFMDEADILADRKAVVSKGTLRCCGSSLFLKNKFGIGYHLTLVLDSSAREHAIARFVASYVPKSEKARRHGRELSFILPHNTVENFAQLFGALETEIKNKTLRLGVSSYGVSMTTLEEVFLHLERDDEAECPMDDLSKEMVRNRALSRSLSLQSKSTSYQSLQNESGMTGTEKPETPLPPEKAPLTGNAFGVYKSFKTKPTFKQTMLALLRLRALRMFRDLQKLYIMIAVPLSCAALGLYMNSQDPPPIEQNSVNLTTNLYLESRLAIHNGTDRSLNRFYKALQMANFSEVAEYDGNYSALLEVKPHIAALNINVFEYSEWNITVIYNDTTQHSLPIVLNVISNAIYSFLALDSDEISQPIMVASHPFPQTSQPERFNIWTFLSALCIGMTFVLVPVSLAVDMVYDREIKARNQLRVNGLSFQLYFLTYIIVLGILMIFICSALLLLIFIFDLPSFREIPAILTLGILIVLYCPSSILCCTCLSYIFDKAETALSILPNIASFAGFIPFTLVIVLDMLQIGGRAVIGLHILFSLANTLYIPYAIIYFIDRVYVMCVGNPSCSESSIGYYDYLTKEIIVMAVSSLLHIPFWLFLLLIADVKKSGGSFKDVIKKLFNNATTADDAFAENSDFGEHEDHDVKCERARVSEILSSNLQNPPVVVLQNLRKEYLKEPLISACSSREEIQANYKLAVRSLSVAVEAGEVLGLLGHNGAGKTSTMKIIVAEEAATKGRVQIRGHNITSNLNQAFQLLGYCPQFDAQWKNITVREHLECYAAIRGVPPDEIPRVVEMYLQGLQITEHANKQSQHCSGGTKRKLSFAMAMVGDPCIVLMDEPSTGMDPRSKRFLWDTILASFQGTRGAILTTHSMEEADALCSRVGIMVKGELRCIGSTQHLKNLYGAGYTLEMKLRNGDMTPTTPGTSRTDSLKTFVHDLFPDAFLSESFADRLVFGVPQSSVKSLAECFNKLEKAKLELNVEEYSFSQTTLEQVFLKFAQYDELNNEV